MPSEIFKSVMEAGELIFVPHNWWHMVINLEYTVAITHNYVSSSNLVDCLHFLRFKQDQISGIRDRPDEAVSAENIYNEFVSRLSDMYPGWENISAQIL